MLDKNSWDLSTLYKNEKELELACEQALKKALEFQKKYSKKLKKLSEDEFCKSIEEYEKISQNLAQIMTYAFLKFAESSNNGIFYAKYQTKTADCMEHLLFFELEFNALPKNCQQKFIAYSNKYAYFLSELVKQKQHKLNLSAEKIALKKDQTGATAFARLFDEHFSNLTFSFKGKKLSEEEMLSILHSDDRNERKLAAQTFTKELKKHQRLLGYIFNMIRKDLKTECEIRKYKNHEEPRHNENKISQKSVDALVKTTEKNFHLVHEYYEKKREILGYEELFDYDRYAPIGNEKDENFDYEKSQKIVLEAFGEFSPVFADIAQKAFREMWIDVYPKPLKRSGAFSHPSTPNTHPYVLLNHTNKRRDLFTLAHELGHAAHQYLSRDVGYLLSDTPLTTSETASVFAEMLVFDKMIKNVSAETKKSMLSSKLEDIFATLFRQINFTTFERLAHKHEGELSLDEFNSLWMRESVKMFGKSVKLTKNYEIWWSYIPHFIHTPFYCYAYAYGQLLVLALFGLYKSGKMRDFSDKYIEFLSLGGSKSPQELVAKFDFNIEDEKFWSIGLKEIEKLVSVFKELR